MRISVGKGKTEYGPGVDIKLTGDEVAQAILDFIAKQNVVISGPLTVMVNGKLCKKGKVYVDPSGVVTVKGRSEATDVEEIVEEDYVEREIPHYPWKDWAQVETVDGVGEVIQWNVKPTLDNGIWTDDGSKNVQSITMGYVQKTDDLVPSIVFRTKEVARNHTNKTIRMKLEDVKQQIDEYFAKVDPAKVIKEFEEMGCVFEPITGRTQEEWDKLAEIIKNELGECIVEEELGEEDPYNWWLEDMTVEDLIDFLRDHNFVRMPIEQHEVSTKENNPRIGTWLPWAVCEVVNHSGSVFQFGENAILAPDYSWVGEVNGIHAKISYQGSVLPLEDFTTSKIMRYK